MAEIGSSVVVVDLDLRPAAARHAHDREAGDKSSGAAEVLAGSKTVEEVVAETPGANVYLMPAGRVEPSSAQRVSTPAMKSMLDELKKRFDYVILACPPIVERSESAVAAVVAGGSLLIIESGATRRDEFLAALEAIAGVHVTSTDVIIDHVNPRDLAGARPVAPPA
jgi:Mrp family chromosome partitioning ATPase